MTIDRVIDRLVFAIWGIEAFASVHRPWKALIRGEIHVTNKTGHLLRIELSPLSNQRVVAGRRTDANINASIGGAGVGGAHEVTYEQATNAEKVQRFALADGETARLESLTSKSYLTATATLPASSSLPGSSHTFKIVDDGLVRRRREYVIEHKHYAAALAAHDNQL